MDNLEGNHPAFDDVYYADEFDDPTRNLYVDPQERALIRTEDVYQTDLEIGTIGYSEKLLSVIANYDNSGRPDGFNAQSMVGKSKKGEVALRLFAVVDPATRTFERAGLQTRGCLAVTACASTVCSMIEGKTFAEALAIRPSDISEELDGVPWDKSYTPKFAIEAVRALVGDFLIREGATRDEVDAVVPCDESSVACLLCENCSLRSTRVEMALAASARHDNRSNTLEDDRNVDGDTPACNAQLVTIVENNAVAAVFDDVRTCSRSGALSNPCRWARIGLVPASMTDEDLEMRVYDYLMDPASRWETPMAVGDSADVGSRDSVFGELNVPEGYQLVERDGEIVLAETDRIEPPSPVAIDCEGVALLMGAHSYYLYDTTAMTDNYAHWAFLAAEGDDEFTFADCVREESRVYPRPMTANSFCNRPFNFTTEQVEQLFAQMRESGNYPDIARTEASDGTVFFYSTDYLSDAYASSLAEWLAVGREMNM